MALAASDNLIALRDLSFVVSVSCELLHGVTISVQETTMSFLVAVLRWTARLCSLVVAGAYLLMAVGEFSDLHWVGPSTFLEWAGIALMTIACAALFIAWRWEFLGAILSLMAVGTVAVSSAAATRFTSRFSSWRFQGCCFLLIGSYVTV